MAPVLRLFAERLQHGHHRFGGHKVRIRRKLGMNLLPLDHEVRIPVVDVIDGQPRDGIDDDRSGEEIAQVAVNDVVPLAQARAHRDGTPLGGRVLVARPGPNMRPRPMIGAAVF